LNFKVSFETATGREKDSSSFLNSQESIVFRNNSFYLKGSKH